MTAPIHTERLDLVPMTPAFLRASLRGDLKEAEEHLGLLLPTSWPEMKPVLELRLLQLEEKPALQPWLLRAVGLRSSGEMVGHIGFHTTPGPVYLEQWSPGGIEYGFGIFQEHRRKGYAREAAIGLMRWAKESHGVTKFVVTISPSNEASQRLAVSLGFVRVGVHLDEVDGPEEVFVLNSVPAAEQANAASAHHG